MRNKINSCLIVDNSYYICLIIMYSQMIRFTWIFVNWYSWLSTHRWIVVCSNDHEISEIWNVANRVVTNCEVLFCTDCFQLLQNQTDRKSNELREYVCIEFTITRCEFWCNCEVFTESLKNSRIASISANRTNMKFCLSFNICFVYQY